MWLNILLLCPQVEEEPEEEPEEQTEEAEDEEEVQADEEAEEESVSVETFTYSPSCCSKSIFNSWNSEFKRFETTWWWDDGWTVILTVSYVLMCLNTWISLCFRIAQAKTSCKV